MARLTRYGERYIAQAVGDAQSFIVDEFVFAFIPGLDFKAPEPPNEPMPPAVNIVHRSAPLKHGIIDQNKVTFSQMLLPDVGNFDFNWIGLVHNNRLIAFAYVPVTKKVKTDNSHEGNTISRNFVVEHKGIADTMPTPVSAESWMYDYSNDVAQLQISTAVNAATMIKGNAAIVKNAHWNTKLSERLRDLEERT
ncbi:phage tail protein [Shewanella abyssi]|uniref:phage tail-collar fiber domain-containing protein n=1 Tax=Shewanella abyssi TaxID=311789 RepID=UPI00200EF3C2|nr:phage tail protein [Shewanella abyssi]MCL1050394.1 phage tail protein [Shewanella abyssi]